EQGRLRSWDTSVILPDHDAKIVRIQPGQTKEAVLALLENQQIAIVGADGSASAYVGTGGTIYVSHDIFDEVLSEYTVIVPMDLNGDGRVNSADARIALRISARLDSATDNQLLAGDTNTDHKISSADARKILRVAARLDEYRW
ncbi:MAG: hypothetical protein IJ766_05515, partial [Clostridia bacterium]|nr:hypothetical protein [Clostridia bacterium]